MQKHDDIAEAYAKGLITEDELSVFEKRKAAEAIVDVAILGKKSFSVSEETRESWIRKIIDNPECTSQLFSSNIFDLLRS